MYGHGEPTAKRVLNLISVQSVAEKIELVFEIKHGYTFAPSTSRSACGA